MPWNDATELVVASSGQISVAPIGTALPTATTAALNAAFYGLGYATEDGVTLTATPEVEEFMAWQSRQAVRRELLGQEIQVAFSLEQWNEATIPLAFGGGTITGTAPNYRYDLPDEDDAIDERSMVIDAVDGAKHYRWVFPRGSVTESAETQLTRGALAVLPITFKALAPAAGGASGYMLTDDPAFAAGS